MESSLTFPEMVLGFAPLSLLVAFFFSVPTKVEFGFTDSGKKYRRVDTPNRIPLLASRGFWLVFGLLIGGAALWAFTTAVISAIQHGFVSLPGARKHPRPVVPWPAAWAYLAGTSFTLLAVILPRLVDRRSGTRPLLQLGAAVLGVAGFFLVILANMFSSFQGISIFVAVVLTASGIAWIWNRLGKVFATVAALCAVSAFIWWLATPRIIPHINAPIIQNSLEREHAPTFHGADSPHDHA